MHFGIEKSALEANFGGCFLDLSSLRHLSEKRFRFQYRKTILTKQHVLQSGTRLKKRDLCKFPSFLHQSALCGSKIIDEKSSKANGMNLIRNKERSDIGCNFKNRG